MGRVMTEGSRGVHCYKRQVYLAAEFKDGNIALQAGIMCHRNMIAVAILVLFTVVGTDAAQCAGRTNLYIPEDNDCEGFYYCNGNGYRSQNPELCGLNAGYMWSQRFQACDHRDHVACDRVGNYWIRSDASADGSEALCYGRESQMLKDPTSCKRYFQCGMNMGRLEDCPPDHFFRKLSGECVLFQYLEAERQEYCALIHNLVTEVSDDCPQQGIQRLTYPNDCTRYYYCDRGSRCVIYCPSGMYFDFITTSCVNHDGLTAAQQAYCSDMTIVIEDPGQQDASYNTQCTMGFTGSIQDPDSCMKYQRCVNGYCAVVHCDEDLYYNPHIGICTRPDTLDDEVRARCGLSQATCDTDSMSVQFDAYDCGRCIVCFHRHATIYQCPQMEIFSQQLLKCVPATAANSQHCPTNQECTNEMYSILSTDDGCSRAEVCVFGSRYIQECSVCGQVVSTSVLACRDPTEDDKYRCSLNIPNGPVPMSSCGSSSQSYYAADSEDTTGKFYYKCNGQNADMRFKCPGTRHFSDGGAYSTATPSCQE